MYTSPYCHEILISEAIMLTDCRIHC